ncbi:MAG TPA: hydroxymethylbilane synthase [Nitrospirales bacterium]|nr:hydroxymethylbilane synthase [Nitrospirales bacterium]HIB55176.1 hydroxymethylbilane synthase [Nitrospirales bacterium]HIN33053.1 hydroxymethylbilane synthase [Nitrospirales bacterium]
MPQLELKIGTRASLLALWQAEWVRTQLERDANVKVTLHKIKTSGDKILNVPLAKIGGKGLFVKEIEEALLRGDIDLAVHSMKDVPTELPDALEIFAMTEREDPRDAISTRFPIAGLDDIPTGATIGTSSLRRQAQLLHVRPDFKIVPLRGNLDTRLRKLQDGEFDAVIVAAAGVRRLGFESQITAYLPLGQSLPAMGQGVLGIECRRNDTVVQEHIGQLNHAPSAFAVRAERALVDRLEGGCQVPIGAHAVVTNASLHLDALVASVDGTRVIRNDIDGSVEDAVALGITLAEQLLSRGADEILAEVYNN